jgi:ribonucleoside-diphosphate reductase alpha chain
MNANENMFGKGLPAQEVAVDVLCEKYAKGDEKSVGAVQARVARALAQYELPALRAEMEEKFLWAQQQGFIPAGRINSAVGMGMKATLMNCFVQPVGDSVTGWHDGLPGIYTAVAEAAETMRRGGGVGYDFSAIRPCGSKVKGTGVVHGSVRRLVQNGRIGRRQARRPDGRAAHRPSRHRALHQRQA